MCGPCVILVLCLANCYFAQIPQDFPPWYYSSMRNLAVLVIHLIATLARLLGPGGVRSLVAESLLLKHQLLIVNRSRQRSPNLSAGDRILAGLLALLVRPTRLLRSAIALKPSTLLGTEQPDPIAGARPSKNCACKFPRTQLKHCERLFQGDAAWIRKGADGEPCRGTPDEAERGFQHSSNHPSHGGRSSEGASL